MWSRTSAHGGCKGPLDYVGFPDAFAFGVYFDFLSVCFPAVMVTMAACGQVSLSFVVRGLQTVGFVVVWGRSCVVV